MPNLSFARALRRNQTGAEALLWSRLKNRQLCSRKFRRQMTIEGFVVDFACVEAKLIVELDGGQHADSTDVDRARSGKLERAGYLVIRFWNDEVFQNLDGVLETIRATLEPDEFTRIP
jgi:very-short-patch-repair endonuclease